MQSYEPLTPERIAELRRMTPQEKFDLMEKLYWDARRAKADELRTQHPEWTEDEVQIEVKRIFLAEGMKEG